MKTNIVKEDGLHHEIEVTVTAEEIDQRVDAKLMQAVQNIQLPGFRKGKVPLRIAKQKYGKSVLGEVLEKTVDETSKKVLNEKKLKPAMQPKIEVKSFDDGADLVYLMSFDVAPEFEVKDYKGLKLTKQVAKPDDSAINEALERIAANNLSTAPIKTKRAAKKGDYLVMDFQGRTADDNEEHPGMEAHDHKLKLGSGQFIPGFEDQLIGKKAGDRVEVKVTFPKEYKPELAGRDAIFDVDIREIHEEAESKIDDALAKSLGMESLDTLKSAIREQLEKEFEQHSRLKLKRKVLDQLDEKHDVEAPPGMLDLEYESIIKQMEAEQAQSGNEEGLSDKDKKELKDIAARRVRLGLILSKIGQENEITISNEELQRAVIQEAQRYPGQEKEVFDYYSKNQQALETLRAPLYEDKVVDFILELADVSEKKVSPEELGAEDDEQEAKSSKKSTAKKAPAKKAAAKKPAAKESASAKKKPAAKKKSAAGGKKPAGKKASGTSG